MVVEDRVTGSGSGVVADQTGTLVTRRMGDDGDGAEELVGCGVDGVEVPGGGKKCFRLPGHL